MRLLAALAVRCAEPDHRAAGDQRRTIARPRLLDRGSDGLRIVPVDPAHRPTRRTEARQLIVRTGQRCRAIDGDLVVVEQYDQPVEPQMPGERDRLVAEALHQAAITGNHIGKMIDQLVAEPRVHQPLGERHADRRRDPLPERPGRRLHAGRMAIFGMPRRLRAPLPECLELIERHALIARQMKQRVEQHRAVTGRQHEAVAVRPCRIGRIEFQEAREQHGRHIGHAHRHAGMTGLCLFDGVDGEKANRIRHLGMGDVRANGNGRQHGHVHIVRLFRSINCRISGVRMSCIARSSFAPWITIELARDMKLCGIIESR